jgi:hypothetical protein
MTFYDDAEFAAINAARLALEEDEGEPRSAAIVAVAVDLAKRHGEEGVQGLVVALTRQYASALTVIAGHQGRTASEVLDRFERHKLEQIDGEDDL